MSSSWLLLTFQNYHIKTPQAFEKYVIRIANLCSHQNRDIYIWVTGVLRCSINKWVLYDIHFANWRIWVTDELRLILILPIRIQLPHQWTRLQNSQWTHTNQAIAKFLFECKISDFVRERINFSLAQFRSFTLLTIHQGVNPLLRSIVYRH